MVSESGFLLECVASYIHRAHASRAAPKEDAAADTSARAFRYVFAVERRLS